MSAQIEYNQMPREPAPAVLSEQKSSAEQPVSSQPSYLSFADRRDDGVLCSIPSCTPPRPPVGNCTPTSPSSSEPELTGDHPQRPNQPMTMDQTTHLRGGRGGDGGVSRRNPLPEKPTMPSNPNNQHPFQP
ncbi:hypothetical protein LZ30DRAFT_202144 [Colletotrichum cereale]|nr:hypothetical protein LZ30DRAFT_202144 [Colletotrichum cereale]